MHRFDVNGEAHFANSVEPSVPSALGEVVLGVHGLSNFRPKPRVRMNRAVAETIKPNFNFGSGFHFMSPDDWTTIYDVKALYSAGFDGTGQAIAVAGQSEVNNVDLDAFRTASGLPARTASNFVRKLVPNSGTATVVSRRYRRVEHRSGVVACGSQGRQHNVCIHRERRGPSTCSTLSRTQSTRISRPSSA